MKARLLIRNNTPPGHCMTNLDVKYGVYAGALPPRAIRMKSGGWGGSTEGMVDGSQPQPWHCLPFVEASTYGLELVYPYETECQVVNDTDGIRFEFDYSNEPGGILSGGEFIFFNSDGPPDFYLFNTRIDVRAPAGHVIRTEPHPRFFTDRTQTVPAARNRARSVRVVSAKAVRGFQDARCRYAAHLSKRRALRADYFCSATSNVRGASVR